FTAASGSAELGTSGLRGFAQPWRLQPLPEYPEPDRTPYRDEAVLVARTPMLSDKAELVSTHGASPSRLWVGALPGSGGERPHLPGFLVQETYLRVYIPVKAGEPAKGQP